MGSTAVIAMPKTPGASFKRPRVPRAVLILAGGAIGDVVMIPEGGLLLGRGHTCDLRIGSPDDGTSRRHAHLFRQGRSVRIRDLGSKNGLFINGRRCREGLLVGGDMVLIGQTVLKVLASAQDLELYRQLHRKRMEARRTH